MNEVSGFKAYLGHSMRIFNCYTTMTNTFITFVEGLPLLVSRDVTTYLHIQ
jgi:hypothetical protein